MIALDTNVLARYLLNDGRSQSAAAEAFLESGEAFTVPITVWLELVWVLGANDCLDQDIARALRHLFGLPSIRVPDADQVLRAIGWFEQGMDFADALHLAQVATVAHMATFDLAFIGRSTKAGTHPPVRQVPDGRRRR